MTRKANLAKHNLSHVNLSSDDLAEAELSEANLSRATLKATNLSGANLAGANLKGADLGGANLSGADLQRANLNEAKLRGADLRDADLTAADLDDADLDGTNVDAARTLAGARLGGAKGLTPEQQAAVAAKHAVPSLNEERCVACRKDAPRVTEAEVAELKPQIPDWELIKRDGVPQLQREFRFPDFAQALAFTDRVGALAEQEGHHPALLTEWGKVTVTWWTHKIRGLHRNDFVMAAKTDQLAAES